MRLTNHHVAGTKRQLKPNTIPHYLAVKTETQQLEDTHMTCGMTWKTEQVRPDRSTDRRGRAPMHDDDHPSGPKTADELHLSCVATWPDIEVPHTPFASLMK